MKDLVRTCGDLLVDVRVVGILTDLLRLDAFEVRFLAGNVVIDRHCELFPDYDVRISRSTYCLLVWQI